MSKREARLARELGKKLEAEKKSARLRESLPAQGVRVGILVTNKTPRQGANPDSVYGMQMTWSCDSPDCEDCWSWGQERQWSDVDWAKTIMPKLSNWEKLTWGEIDKFSSDTGHKLHHNMETNVICGEAISRLHDLERFSDVIFRFRLGNKKRLWGFRVVDHFEIIWFDPSHKIYPIDPD
tara:strand:+ start:9335 stop:9874 length:540 start_codon:yes stop_codon:yes gene_type:complete